MIILSSWYILCFILLNISWDVCLGLVCLLNISWDVYLGLVCLLNFRRCLIFLLLFDLWGYLSCLIWRSLFTHFILSCWIWSRTTNKLSYLWSGSLTRGRLIYLTWRNCISGIPTQGGCILSGILSRQTWISRDNLGGGWCILSGTVKEGA